MQYGELIDVFAPEREGIYSHFVKYFNNPTLTQVKNVQDSTGQMFSMYAVKIYNLLANENRYIICIVHGNNLSLGTVEELRTIQWISLQTRRLSERYNCQTHSYIAKLEGSLDEMIERVDKTKESSVYHCENIPELVITLLHTEKRNENTYQNRGKIINALETYETIITFKEEDFLK